MNSTNIQVMDNGKVVADLPYEDKAHALACFQSMLRDGKRMEDDDALVLTEQLGRDGSVVTEGKDGQPVLYTLVEMGFEAGDRVSITYLDGVTKVGTVKRRTAATATQVRVRFDGDATDRAVCPTSLDRL